MFWSIATDSVQVYRVPLFYYQVSITSTIVVAFYNKVNFLDFVELIVSLLLLQFSCPFDWLTYLE